MAYAIIGRLVVATLLTLLFLQRFMSPGSELKSRARSPSTGSVRVRPLPPNRDRWERSLLLEE